MLFEKIKSKFDTVVVDDANLIAESDIL